MSYQERLEKLTIAISTSDSRDMAALGLSDEHLRDAMTEIARHLLALGARLVYGGDLRQHGFTELLFELAARYRRDSLQEERQADVINYIAWPVHIRQDFSEIEGFSDELSETAELICLTLKGTPLSKQEREKLKSQTPNDSEWHEGLTAMRNTMLANTHARIILGGQRDKYKGKMPGIAEEALISLEANQPLYILGGFGGCARDIAESMNLTQPWTQTQHNWNSRDAFKSFNFDNLNNGLTPKENTTLATTPHINQAVALILRGLIKISTKSKE